MSTNGKSWYRPRLRTLLVLTLIAFVGWSGYSYWSDYQARAARKAREMMAPSVGAFCRIDYDGGQSASGKFVKLNDDWVVLETADNKVHIWIPRNRILLMQVDK